jgi:hypothetical protein
MVYRDVTDDERARLHEWLEESARLKRQIQVLFKELTAAFDSTKDVAYLGISFTESESDNILLVKTPVTEGRLRSRIALLGEILANEIIVERPEIDASGSICWVAVWAFRNSAGRSIVYLQEPGDALAYQPIAPYKEARTEVFERLGKSIAYALAAGPLEEA